MSADPPRLISFRNESDYYGASFVAARYAGLAAPDKPLYPLWQHGWAPDYWQVHPYVVLASLRSHRKSEHFFVARKSERDYLESCGYRNVRAAGNPAVYLPAAEIPRVPGSLLVMPVHTAFYTENRRGFGDYARRIEAVRGRFTKVVVCVSPSCLERGYWSDDFRRLGFEVIGGANIFDPRAYFRLRELLSSFEYVTTNSYGSLIAYASYFGAKVSIFGDYTAYRLEDFRNSPFNIQYPELNETFVRLYSEETARSRLARFFVSPWEAREAREWAAGELGEENRMAPGEMAGYFRWRPRERLAVVLKKAIGGRDPSKLNAFFHALRVAHSKWLGRFLLRRTRIFSGTGRRG
ncbi:MAG TPA: hypothetical protein VL404_02960 [Candidatus Eisenbacteria bacterium]|nr:hypothetical protein [Candidatus Eisenbacteria bacterium]